MPLDSFVEGWCEGEKRNQHSACRVPLHNHRVPKWRWKCLKMAWVAEQWRNGGVTNRRKDFNDTPPSIVSKSKRMDGIDLMFSFLMAQGSHLLQLPRATGGLETVTFSTWGAFFPRVVTRLAVEGTEKKHQQLHYLKSGVQWQKAVHSVCHWKVPSLPCGWSKLTLPS